LALIRNSSARWESVCTFVPHIYNLHILLHSATVILNYTLCVCNNWSKHAKKHSVFINENLSKWKVVVIKILPGLRDGGKYFFVRAGFISSPVGFGVSYNLFRMYLSGLGVEINTVVKCHNPEPGEYTLFVAK